MSIPTHSHYMEADAKTMAIPASFGSTENKTHRSGKACPACGYIKLIIAGAQSPTRLSSHGTRVTIPGWRGLHARILVSGRLQDCRAGGCMHQTNGVDRWEQKRVRHSHEHAPPVNVNQALVEILRPGERMADTFALVIGSWKFMIVQSLIMAAWIVAIYSRYFG